MADPNGFMSFPRKDAPKRPVDERLGDWHEVYAALTPSERDTQVRKQATISPMGLRIFDKFVWLWRKIDASLPWEPASIIAIARRPA